METLGIAAKTMDLAKRFAARHPSIAHRILGKPPVFNSAKEHRITVDCRTGQRSAETTAMLPPPACRAIWRGAPVTERKPAIQLSAAGVQTKVLITIEIEGEDKPACVIESLSRWFE